MFDVQETSAGKQLSILIEVSRSPKKNGKFTAIWIKSRRAFGWARSALTNEAEGYSLPQELEKAREADYFTSITYYILSILNIL